jgi:hypothetical protein
MHLPRKSNVQRNNLHRFLQQNGMQGPSITIPAINFRQLLLSKLLSLQELPNPTRNCLVMGLEGKVSGIQKMHFRIRNVALICLGSRRNEK